MNTNSPVYNELNKAWKSTCRVLFGEEIGELREYEEWLHEYIGKERVEKSMVSRKEVYLTSEEYCHNAKFIAFDEIDFNKKFEPLNINEIKDIDSIVESLQERFYYSGNVVLGTSKFVEKSSNVVDSFYILGSSRIDESDHIAYSKDFRYCRFIFGGYLNARSNHMIKGCFTFNCNRCFEYYLARSSSDLYYSANISGCNDCMFCFNLYGKKHTIGNLELQRDKYLELKKKLISEIASELRQNKKIPSLLELIPQTPTEIPKIKIEEEMFDINPINESFKQTFKLLFRKEPQRLEEYKDYLLKHLPPIIVLRNNISQNELFIPDFFEPILKRKDRLISQKEAQVISKNNKMILDMQEVEKPFRSISLSKIAVMPFGVIEGKNTNVHGSAMYAMNSIDCYYGINYVESKSCAFSNWPRQSSNAFGCGNVFDSHFCINTYYSKRMNRAFEIDSCTNCSDLYYSHNCENVNDSMFCFNIKNLSHAIGNAQLPPDQYRKIKDMLVEQMADEILSKKELKYNIYNIGCGKK
jgi:hypothetical protein